MLSLQSKIYMVQTLITNNEDLLVKEGEEMQFVEKIAKKHNLKVITGKSVYMNCLKVKLVEKSVKVNKSITSQKIGTILNTCGLTLNRYQFGYYADRFVVLIDKKVIFNCQGVKALKQWFWESGWKVKFDLIVKEHGKQIIKEWDSFDNTSIG